MYDSWKKYAESVSERCGAVQGILNQVGRDVLTTDEGVQAEMDRAGRREGLGGRHGDR
ncbi:hypothetical protein [Streptomyces sp. NBC_01233]|uniref:hypothetical protein n=1 Tax=Streptomyces sp. NBC_01233 TaxID=2903787 RepID=UPI002E15851B